MKTLDVGSLMVYTNLDTKEYDNGIKKMQGATESFLNSAKLKFAVISAVVVKSIDDMISAYGRYEQLVGGVETLFKDSANVVMAYAENAYKTAGISANQYMETVTAFSASLLQSLGGDTAESAKIADMAITDMADNANKMGTSMEAIQNAYQGFAKQNYTMLDNLKLGYGGTKTEMERLLADAEKLTGVHYDIQNLNDVFEAIHVIQTELGITGTTAKEAEQTIEGSANAMKASFENLKTALAGGGNLTKALQAFSKSVMTFLKNLIPRIVEIVKNIPTLLIEAFKSIPQLLTEIAPMILDGLKEIPSLMIDLFKNVLPEMNEAFIELLMGLANGILEAIPFIVSYLPQLVYAITEFFTNSVDQLIQTGIMLLTALVTAMPEIITAIVNVLPAIITAILTTLENHTDDIVMAGVQLLTALVNALPEIIVAICKAIPQIIAKLLETLNSFHGRMRENGKELFAQITARVSETFGTAMNKARDLVYKIRDGIVSGFSSIRDAGTSLVQGLWNGIAGGWDWLIGQVRSLANRLVASVKSSLGIHSPSTVFAGIGENLAEGLDVGYTVQWDEFEDHALNSFQDMISAMNGMDLIGRDIGYGLGQTLTAEAMEPVTTQVVLDGKVIAESTNSYNRNLQLAVGMR